MQCITNLRNGFFKKLRILKSAYSLDNKVLSNLCFYSTENLEGNIKKAANVIQESSQILVMTGAGLSTASGIPDFRSPKSGLYSNLQNYELPYPEAIFDIGYFMKNPLPFYSLAKDLYPGVNYQPNIGHYFLVTLYNKKKLSKLYTQNIDGLERLSGIPEEKLTECHGSFKSASCTRCHQKHDPDDVKNAILQGEGEIQCENKSCLGLVKPDIVFFGEQLPDSFWEYENDVQKSDLLIVVGTSLAVYPFASIADAISWTKPRILINRDAVGSIGVRENDILCSGDISDTVRSLAEELGWKKDLESLL